LQFICGFFVVEGVNSDQAWFDFYGILDEW